MLQDARGQSRHERGMKGGMGVEKRLRNVERGRSCGGGGGCVPLTALLGLSGGHVGGNEGPVLSTVGLDELAELDVLLVVPVVTLDAAVGSGIKVRHCRQSMCVLCVCVQTQVWCVVRSAGVMAVAERQAKVAQRKTVEGR